MRYISVGCVVGIIAGFCIGPGEHESSPTCVTSHAGLAGCTLSAVHVQLIRWITLLPGGGLRNSRLGHRFQKQQKGMWGADTEQT